VAAKMKKTGTMRMMAAMWVRLTAGGASELVW
jgi:hypothetical protein